jgi:hypothetical protein
MVISTVGLQIITTSKTSEFLDYINRNTVSDQGINILISSASDVQFRVAYLKSADR